MADGRFLFETEFDPSGIRQMEAAFAGLPERIKKVTDRLIQIDEAAYRQQGDKIAQALLDGMRRRLSGQRIDLSDYVRTNTGVDQTSRQWQRAAATIRESFGDIGRAGANLTRAERDLAALQRQMESLQRLRDRAQSRPGGQSASSQASLDRRLAEVSARMERAAQSYQRAAGSPARDARAAASARPADSAGLDRAGRELTQSLGKINQQLQRVLASVERTAAQADSAQRRRPTAPAPGQQAPAAAAAPAPARQQAPQGQTDTRTARVARALGISESDVQRVMDQRATNSAALSASRTLNGEDIRAAVQRGAFEGTRAGAAFAARAQAGGADTRFATQLGVAQGQTQAYNQGAAIARAQAQQARASQQGISVTELGRREAEARAQEQMLRQQQRSQRETQRALDQSARESAASSRAALSGPERIVRDFRTGFRGDESTSVPEQFGRAARFSVQYGAAYRALTLFTNGLQQVTQDFLTLEDAIATLAVATDRSISDGETQRMAADFGRQAVKYGFNNAVGVQAGAQAIGYYGLANASMGEQMRIAEAAAASAMRLNRMSGNAGPAGMSTMQRQMTGIQRSFNVPDSQVERVEDMVTFISRRGGTDVAEVLASTAEIGTMANQAGFTMAQTMAILNQIQKTTGQTPLGAAGSLRQGLTRADDPRIMDALRSVGVNTEGTTLAEQLTQLSEMNLSRSQNRQLVQVFGRGNNDQSMSILINNLEEINALAAEAEATDVGYAQRAFNEAMKSIAQQIQRFGAAIVGLGTELAKSGVLAPLGVIVVAMTKVAEVLTDMVRLWNQLPAPMRNLAFGLVELAVAMHFLSLAVNSQTLAAFGRLIQRMTAVNLAANMAAAAQGRWVAATRAATAAGGGRAAVLSNLVGPVGQAGARGAVAARAGGAARGSQEAMRVLSAPMGPYRTAAEYNRVAAATAGARAGAAGVAASTATAVMPYIIPIIIASLAVYGIYAAFRDQKESAVERGRAVEKSVNRVGGASSDDLKNTSKELATVRREIQEERKWSLGGDLTNLYLRPLSNYGKDKADGIGGVAGYGSLKGEQAATDNLSKAYESHAEAVDDAEEKLRTMTSNNPAAMLELDSAEALGHSLESLSDRGYNAAEQMMYLGEALGDAQWEAANAGTAVMRIKPGEGAVAATQYVAAGLDAMTTMHAENSKKLAETGFTGDRGVLRKQGWDEDEIKKSLAMNETQKAIGKANLDAANTAATRRIEKLIQDRAALNPGGFLSSDQRKEIERRSTTILEEEYEKVGVKLDRDSLNELKVALRDVSETYATQEMNPQNLNAMFQQLPALAQQKADEASLRAGGDALLAAEMKVKDFKGGEDMARAYIGQQQGEIAKQAALGNLGGALQAMKGVAEAQRHLRNFELNTLQAEQEMNAARRERIGNQAAKQASTFTEDNLAERTKLQISTLEQQLNLTTDVDERLKLEAQLNDTKRRQVKEDIQVTNARRLSGVSQRDTGGRLQAELANAKGLQSTLTEGTAEYWQSVEQINSIKEKIAEDLLNTEAARRLASVSGRNTTGRLHAELANAQARMNFAISGSAEYWQAVDQVNQLKDRIAEHALQVADAARRLSRDRRDVIGGIRDDMAAASARLSFARQGGDQLGALEAENQLKDLQQKMRDELVARQGAAFRAMVAPGDDLNAAGAAVREAQLRVEHALHGTAAWFEATAALREAQYKASQLTRQHAANRRLLGIDLTDPVAQAAADLQTARAELGAAGSPWERTNAELQVRRSEASLEQAAFQQRIGDLQTNEQLGRITHATYMEYLRAEHNRLSSIANRTRQQQEQLNEVEKLMQAAADQLSGQFNVGDIKLPTVYEVRRAVGASMAGGATGQVNNYASTVNLHGVDFAQVVEYLNQALGTSATLRRW